MSHKPASAVVMVLPGAFRYNTETGKDNEFQKSVALDNAQLSKAAMDEFNAMAEQLRRTGIQVTAFDNGQNDTPDAVFPNNWFSTDRQGNLHVYPMLCPNRQREVLPEQLTDTLNQHGYQVKETVDLRPDIATFEGTGALIIDHANNTGYCALSQRAQATAVTRVQQALGLDDIHCFDTRSSSGKAVYHTNVLMSIGVGYAIVCVDVVMPAQRDSLLEKLGGKDVITITEAQMQQFCGNILQLQDNKGQLHIVMSSSAHQAFTEGQLRRLSRHGEIQHFDVSHIEKVGGGSVRCMLAENFLPKR